MAQETVHVGGCSMALAKQVDSAVVSRNTPCIFTEYFWLLMLFSLAFPCWFSTLYPIKCLEWAVEVSNYSCGYLQALPYFCIFLLQEQTHITHILLHHIFLPITPRKKLFQFQPQWDLGSLFSVLRVAAWCECTGTHPAILWWDLLLVGQVA